MHWADALYEETKQKWKAAGSPQSKYAIFYSPVIENAKIALIGYNPGGDGASIAVDDIKVPEAHEYITKDYRIATNVRRIFKAADLALADTVKFNLIFFRTKAAKDLRNIKKYKELIQFSEQKVLEILTRIHPAIIITEGFATFDRLLRLKGGTQTEIVRYNDRAILLVGKTADNIKMFGMLHPTGAFGISNNLLNETGRQLKQRIRR